MGSPCREEVKGDRDAVFLNAEEFGDLHTIDGRQVMAVVDEPQTAKSGMSAAALAGAEVIGFAKNEDLPAPRAEGDTLNVDGRMFIVVSWRVDCGMAEIALRQNISR